MRQVVAYVCLCAVVNYVTGYEHYNESVNAVPLQLPSFRHEHPETIGVWTRTTGDPIDIRDTAFLNTPDIFENKHHFIMGSHLNRERIPERVVHAKGYGAYGYFEVTHDVSKYTTADVFNGVGKRTPVVGRFSIAIQNLGGNDLARETRGLSMKFYTKQGNLDLISLHLPIFLYKDPINFGQFAHAFKRNPKTGTFDNNMRWDFLTLRPDHFHTIMWLLSDIGLPDGYRKINYFPIHTYEVYNKKGQRYYVKFNFRTELGVQNLTNAEAAAISLEDPDYFNTDLYNAIAKKNYPAWQVEMDILTEKDLIKVDYDPFDVTRLWERGTYHTVPLGRLVFNRLVDNNFKDVEISGFCPDNLVPGIMGPLDVVFKSRRVFYQDAQNYRLGTNYANIRVNEPMYDKTYSRDGVPPVLDNMKDAPNYYPNSFNGPMPYVDENRPTDRIVIFHRNAVDLQPMAEFYNEIIESDDHRQRLANNLAETLVDVVPDIEKKAFHLMSLIDEDLSRRVNATLTALRAADPQERQREIAQCIAKANEV